MAAYGLLEDVKVASVSLQNKLDDAVFMISQAIDKEIKDAHYDVTLAPNVLAREDRVFELHSFCRDQEVDPVLCALRKEVNDLKSLSKEQVESVLQKFHLLIEAFAAIRALEWRSPNC